MKVAGIIGCCLGAASFLFATYVSVTGGPNLAPSKRSPDQQRVAQIAASAPKNVGGGCCAQKQKETTDEAGCPNRPKDGSIACGNEASGEKCPHH